MAQVILKNLQTYENSKKPQNDVKIFLQNLKIEENLFGSSNLEKAYNFQLVGQALNLLNDFSSCSESDLNTNHKRLEKLREHKILWVGVVSGCRF